ncbi:hypothetical protein MMC29_005204 [Sticta canariensis]|nr:hypothetical protein [Sticta canariensis]
MSDLVRVAPAPVQAPQKANDKEWERKQRLREYRVASRREKRNRKADEKKQRKLNATILRRMTRNPERYTTNADRNRLRDIETERRKIQTEAIRQAERLAAEHDPGGVSFNVGPVMMQEDGRVISLETLRKRQEKSALEQAKTDGLNIEPMADKLKSSGQLVDTSNQACLTAIPNGMNPDRFAQMIVAKSDLNTTGMSKTQLKKKAALAPRPPLPKPIIPEGISTPAGEENWLALWDLSDHQLERRVIKEKKKKAADRKTLRVKQQAGQVERRVARDEKRRVYREVRFTWQAIKGEQSKEQTKLRAMEDEESKKIAVAVNKVDRKAALDHCMQLGFTLANTPGVGAIKPRVKGLKGIKVDFDAIDIGESRNTIKSETNKKRVDLDEVPNHVRTNDIPTGVPRNSEEQEEFIKLDVGESQEHESLQYNHRFRRKLRRTIDDVQVRRELLVRQRALDHYAGKSEGPPAVLLTPPKPLNVRGRRILENGALETAKQERVWKREESSEKNRAARILRQQAKQVAVEAGLQKHAELTGRLPSRGLPVSGEEKV